MNQSAPAIPSLRRYDRVVRFSYLGNLIAVHFFTLAAPVILKANRAPTGTLSLFASLSLLWSFRAAIVPPLMRYLGVNENPPRAIQVLLVTRPIVAAVFLICAALSPFIDSVERLETLMLGAGALVCLLAGVERGFLDAAAVLASKPDTATRTERFPVYEAAGVIIGSTLSSGLVIAISAELGVAVCFALIGSLVILITVPVLSDIVSIRNRAADERSRSAPARRIRVSAGRMIPWPARNHAEFVLTFSMLVLGWLGIDLAYRCTQPLMLRQGVPLRWVGFATIGTGLVLLAIFAITQLAIRSRTRTDRPWAMLSYVVPAAATVLLCVASLTGEPSITVAGLIALQIGYFFFSIFATDLTIVYGRDAGSAEATVLLSGAAYVTAHILVPPILYLTTEWCDGFTMTCIVASALVVICTLARFALPRFHLAPGRT